MSSSSLACLLVNKFCLWTLFNSNFFSFFFICKNSLSRSLSHSLFSYIITKWWEKEKKNLISFDDFNHDCYTHTHRHTSQIESICAICMMIMMVMDQSFKIKTEKIHYHQQTSRSTLHSVPKWKSTVIIIKKNSEWMNEKQRVTLREMKKNQMGGCIRFFFWLFEKIKMK